MALRIALHEVDNLVRDGIAKLTLADVNRVILRHIRPRDMEIMMITKDAEAMKLGIRAEAVPAVEIFRK